MSTFTFGAATLGGSVAAFGGQANPFCNYTSPLAKKFVYREANKVYYPLRRHIFRMKVKTAAELRFHDVVKRYTSDKISYKWGARAATGTNSVELDHMGSIIPKDEYEIKKFTSYMTSKKMSEDYKNHMQELWTKFLFIAESTNFVGSLESIHHQNKRPATDEEFMSFLWFSTFATTTLAFVVTLTYWWWKYGQAPQYMEVK